MKIAAPLISILPFLILFNSFSPVIPIPSGEEIIKKMHRKWDGKWGRNMRFDQNVYLYKNDSLVKQEVWQEILSSPKNLQIRFNGFETGNGVLFKNDSVYTYAEGKLIRKEERVHHLLLLGFDVYFLSPEETILKLKDLGFDLSKTYERSTENGCVYVVGTTNPDDKTSSQFWINKAQLYLEKVILNRNGNISEVDMKNYQLVDSYPVAMEIEFRNNGELFMVEKYFDVSFPEMVDQKIFDPATFAESRW